jgi:tripartite ATP-independent transporter DctM subunit
MPEASPVLIAVVATLLMFALILLRLPIGLALGLAGFFGYAWLDGARRAVTMLTALPSEIISGGYSFSVIPMFILMGAVAARTGLSAELFAMAKALSRRGARGTLAAATIGACGLFGAICGSSVATAATMGRIAVPEMRAARYDDRLATGSVAAGGTLGILIPPSVILVIYALLAEQSVPVLFAAAMLPGILLTLLCIAVVKAVVMAKPEWGPPIDIKYAPGERLRILAGAWKVVGIFLLSIGGLYAGWFSPTEAAAIGAGATILVGALDRRLTLRDLAGSIQETTVVSASLFFIFLGALMYGRFIALTRMPHDLVAFVGGLDLSPQAVALVIVGIYLVLGCFLETVSMVLITVPVFLPLLESVGYNGVWFGIMLVVAAEMGLITPPVGMNLFVIRAQTPNVSIPQIAMGALPFLSAQIVLVVILVFWPRFVLILPEALHLPGLPAR